MKSFSQFLNELKSPAQQAKDLNLVSDGHGGYYDHQGEFIAKSIGGRLLFWNKAQVRGGKDPKQTDKEKTISSPGYRDPNRLREQYLNKEIFNEDEWVKSLVTEQVGKIIRRGTNYLICVTEDGDMFKSWIKDLIEYSEVKMDSKERLPGKPNTLIGTTGYRKNAEDSIKFINKYRKK
jgi:hypothetical protein